MSDEGLTIDILLYIALSEEFDAAMEILGDGFKPKELTDIALTGFFGGISSKTLAKDFKVAVFPAGKMGITRSANITSAIIEKLKPADVVVLGIAGSLSNDLEPGDVFIPDSVVEYLANSASRGEDLWTFDTSGNQFHTSPRLLNRFQVFPHTGKAHHTSWLEDTVRDRAELIPKPIQDALVAAELLMRGECKLYVGDDRKLASGPAVGKGKAFLNWLRKDVDRKIEAIEMESAGVYDAAFVRTPAPRTTAIRGISDYADSRKEKIETSAKGLFRKLAAKNALSLFIRGIEAGLFQPDAGRSTDALPSSSATPSESRVDPGFAIGGITGETKDSDAEPHLTDSNWQLVNPALLPSFVGREKEIAEIRRLLGRHRIVTLKATGGIGKTRLVRELLASPHEFPGVERRVFVTLEQVTHDDKETIVDALVSQLKALPSAGGNGIPAVVATLQSRSTLLIVDNCETSPVTLPSLLLDLLDRCPRLRILATSQRQLGIQGIEAVYDLPCLSVPKQIHWERSSLETFDGFRLFTLRARLADGNWELRNSETDAICKVLALSEGVPLAIEIVAAWTPFKSLDQIGHELEATPLGPITAFDEDNSISSDRHRSLWRCVEWSFQLLPKPEKDLFVKLGIFVGAFTEESVRSVCDVREPMPLLIRLVKASFLHPVRDTSPRRFSSLRFTRVFAQDKARAIGIEQDLIRRHVDFFFNLVSPLNSEGEWEPVESTSYEHDWPDLIAAAEAAQHFQERRPAVWQISGAIGSFLMRIGLWNERERLVRLSLDVAERAQYWAAMERSLLDLGRMMEARGNWRSAEEQYRRCLFFADRNKHPSPTRQAMALQNLGDILHKLGRTAEAELVQRKLGEVTSRLQDLKGKPQSLDRLARMDQARGKLDEAEAKFREALAIREFSHHEEGLARSHSNLGVVLTLKGAWAAAESSLRRSLSFWESRNVAKEQAVVLHLIGDLFRRQHRFADAEICFRKSLQWRANDPKGRAVALAALGKVLQAQNRIEEAIVVLQESFKIGESLNDVEGQGIALDDLGAIFSVQQNWEEALRAFDASCRLKRSARRMDVVGLAISLDRIAQLHTRRKNWVEAKTAYEESLRLSRTAGRSYQAVVTLMNLALMNAAQGQKHTALSLLDQAVSSSLRSEGAEERLLFEVRKLRNRLARRMEEGVPWNQWRDASYVDSSIRIRRQFAKERNEGLWQQAADGYAGLAREFAESGQQIEFAISLNEMGGALRHQLAFEKSEEVIRKGLSIFTLIELPIGQAASWHKLGDLFAAQRNWEKAVDAYYESIRLKREAQDDEGEAITQDGLARACIDLGRLDDAVNAAARAWQVFEEIGTAQQKWYPLGHLIWLALERNEPSTALDFARALTNHVRSNRNLSEKADRLFQLLERGSTTDAKALLSIEGFGRSSVLSASAQGD